MLQSNWNKIGYFSLRCGFIVCLETLRPILLNSLVFDNMSMLPLRFKNHLEQRCFSKVPIVLSQKKIRNCLIIAKIFSFLHNIITASSGHTQTQVQCNKRSYYILFCTWYFAICTVH